MAARIYLVVLSLLLLAAPYAHAAGTVAECEIVSDGKTEFKGDCLFMAEKGGSFSVQSVKKDAPLYDEILVVSVYIEKKGRAEVRGLTAAGINSRWGEATRSGKDKSCWDGADFRICVRAKK